MQAQKLKIMRKFYACWFALQFLVLVVNAQICESGDCESGKGTAKLPNGSYTGEFKKGKYHGQGTFTYKSGAIYTGQFENGVFSGIGKLVKDGNTFEGSFKNDKPNGEGKLTTPRGDVYTGSFVDYKKNGQGTYVWAAGHKYVGNWVNDKRQGQGAIYLSNGKKQYEGEWENDLPKSGN